MDSASLRDMLIEYFSDDFGFFVKEIYKTFFTKDFLINATENDFAEIDLDMVNNLYFLRQKLANLPITNTDYGKLRVKKLLNIEHLSSMARAFKKGSFLISRGTAKFSEMFRSLFDKKPFNNGLFIFDGEAPGGAIFAAAERWKWGDQRPSKWPYLAISIIEEGHVIGENKDTFVRFFRPPESSRSFRGDILSESDTEEILIKADKRCLVYTFDGAYNSSDDMSFEKDMLEFFRKASLRAKKLLQRQGCALIKTYLTRELNGTIQAIMNVLPFFETIDIIKPPSSPLLNREIYVFFKNRLEIEKKCEAQEILEIQKKIHNAVINTSAVLSFLIESDLIITKKINLMEKLYEVRLEKCKSVIESKLFKSIPHIDKV